MQFCWICICRISGLFSGPTTFYQQDGAPAHRECDTVTMLQRERERERERDTRVYPSRDVATQFARFESGGLSSGVHSREGLPFADPWCEGVEKTSAEGVEAAGPHHHREEIAQWRSRLNACVRVNGTCHYVDIIEHKFWASDFLLCFVCFIDTDFRKCDRFDIGLNMCKVKFVKCVTFVSETFTRYGRQKIITPMTLAFSCEVVHAQIWKPVNICKSYGKKISGTFLCGHSVLTTVDMAYLQRDRLQRGWQYPSRIAFTDGWDDKSEPSWKLYLS